MHLVTLSTYAFSEQQNPLKVDYSVLTKSNSLFLRFKYRVPQILITTLHISYYGSVWENIIVKKINNFLLFFICIQLFLSCLQSGPRNHMHAETNIQRFSTFIKLKKGNKVNNLLTITKCDVNLYLKHYAMFH
jgi:hypothetical protein